jgi:hypothetical protein
VWVCHFVSVIDELRPGACKTQGKGKPTALAEPG